MITSKATIFLRGDAIYVVAVAVTRRGYTFKTEQVQTLSARVEAAALGKAVLRALDAYEENVPDIGDPRQHAGPMLRALGFSGIRQFERGTKWTGVQVVDGIAYVIPSKPYGRGGYFGLTRDDAPEGGIAHVPLEPEALGAAVLSRLAMSVPHPT